MRRILILLLSLTLASCGKQSTTSIKDSINNANYYLGLAKNSNQPQKSEYLLKAGVILAQKAQYLKAQETFSFIEPSYLSPIDKETYYLYYALSLQELSQTAAALTFFKQIQTPENHPIDWQVTYRKSLANAYLSDGNYYEAAKIRIELEDLLLTEEQLEENHEFIWRALNQINPEFLKLYQTDFSNPVVNGWLELAFITHKHEEQPNQLLTALNVWKQRFPLHPASSKMPSQLQQVANAKVYRPKQIALLLPLSGRLAAGGRMIRDGFLAAHYSNKTMADDTVIKVYDTAQSLSPMTPYEQAIEDGADFIVGPLTKEAVEAIANQEQLAVPQLSLNRLDAFSVNHPELYQFGLPIEDEARQIAKLAIEKQHETAIVLVPSNEQGDRILQAFSTVFEGLEGSIAEVQRYDDPKEIKSIIQRLLNIDLSENRNRRLEQILGTPLEFVQRRRQDADMVFIAASPTDARRIKPFLNFYYAQDLPVYAISRINPGSENTQLNSDLNGITFTDSPILISDDPKVRQLRNDLKEIVPSITSSFGRLFALGYDAYRLLPDLNILKAFQQYQQRGLSGLLSVNANGEIERTLSIAHFNQGVAREVVSSAQSERK